ncbi:MAG: formylglycine-generating enzyme family protein [Actinobacteria bacterium]|nr:formylglycine-generating enzyme family protein [Actinomycetota bacterium]
MSACCAPGRPESNDTRDEVHDTDNDAAPRPKIELISLAGGEFQMGTADKFGFPADGEGPVRDVTVDSFSISATTVSNAQFSEFVTATGYQTEAEHFGWTFVFHLFLPDDFPPTRAVAAAPWWRQVEGACWSNPFGPQSDLQGLYDHPVTHVSWNDAVAFCSWAEVRLPTEREWEFAARGGLDQQRYPWGDNFDPDGRTMCNIFEGTFPTENTAADGFIGTAPVKAFEQNGFGLHNVAGNVWEWCHDWFGTIPGSSPTGPDRGEAKVMRGGSYLCHDSYCNRYRVGARSSNTADSSTGNLGFRVAADG